MDVYSTLAQHQRTNGWAHRELATCLLWWAKVFDSEFKLRIANTTLRIDVLRASTLGHFRRGCNGFGLEGEIAINILNIELANFYDTLGTLLHEQLHAWQQAHGRPGRGTYHNVEFRNRAAAYGVLVDQYGHQRYAEGDTPFMRVLAKHGLDVPAIHKPPARVRGSSKLKLWQCGCRHRSPNVRVAVADFAATCLHCGHQFQLVAS